MPKQYCVRISGPANAKLISAAQRVLVVLIKAPQRDAILSHSFPPLAVFTHSKHKCSGRPTFHADAFVSVDEPHEIIPIPAWIPISRPFD